MQTILCDSCRKPIKDADRDVNYFTVLDKAMCIPCKEKYEVKLTLAMRTKKKYVFLDQKKLLVDTLQKMCK